MNVTVSPKTSTLKLGQTQQFSASVTGDAGHPSGDVGAPGSGARPFNPGDAGNPVSDFRAPGARTDSQYHQPEGEFEMNSPGTRADTQGRGPGQRPFDSRNTATEQFSNSPGPRPSDGTIRCGDWEGVVTWSEAKNRLERYDDGSGKVVSQVPVASPDGIQRYPEALSASQRVYPEGAGQLGRGVQRDSNYSEGAGQLGRPTPQDSASSGVKWTASSGSIDANGLFTAPQSAGSATITATAGTASDTASVSFS